MLRQAASVMPAWENGTCLFHSAFNPHVAAEVETVVGRTALKQRVKPIRCSKGRSIIDVQKCRPHLPRTYHSQHAIAARHGTQMMQVERLRATACYYALTLKTIAGADK